MKYLRDIGFTLLGAAVGAAVSYVITRRVYKKRGDELVNAYAKFHENDKKKKENEDERKNQEPVSEGKKLDEERPEQSEKLVQEDDRKSEGNDGESAPEINGYVPQEYKKEIEKRSYSGNMYVDYSDQNAERKDLLEDRGIRVADPYCITRQKFFDNPDNFKQYECIYYGGNDVVEVDEIIIGDEFREEYFGDTLNELDCDDYIYVKNDTKRELYRVAVYPNMYSGDD